MYTGNYAQLMAEYNRWMNEKVYDACARLPDDERKRHRGAYFDSIHGTLNHILWGDGIWLGRFNGKSYPTAPIREWLYQDFAAMRSARMELDQELQTWAAGVSEEWLREAMTWKSGLYGVTKTHPRWVFVAQMFNHQTHHRGQVTTLLTQLDIDVGITDLPMLPLLLRE
jgi:uncharacterized damage-inducible protein DinB